MDLKIAIQMAQKCSSVISATQYERLHWHNSLFMLAMCAAQVRYKSI